MTLQTSLNCWKHHARWSLQALASLKLGEHLSLLAALQKIGNSQMDLYLGDLSLKLLDSQVIEQLQQRGIGHARHYAEWLVSNGEYQQLTLNDGSGMDFALGRA